MNNKTVTVIIALLIFALNVYGGERDFAEKEIKRLLSGKKYNQLFLTSSSEIIDKTWNKGENYNLLIGVIGSEKTTLYEKFLSAEIIYYFKKDIPEKYSEILGKAYTYALSKTSMEDRKEWIGVTGNAWGFLYDMDSKGSLGKRLIGFGNSSVKNLFMLLDNSERVLYEGSKEATVGNSYNYQIKDFAAYYLSKILNIQLKYTTDRKVQNLRIERFKLGVMKKENIVDMVGIEYYKRLNHNEPDQTKVIKKREIIDRILNLLLKLPENSDIHMKLSESSKLHLLKFISNDSVVKKVKIYNGKVQMSDTGFLVKKNINEDKLIKIVREMIHK